ncbi:zinc finger and SCAN domain-containing protein 26 isoform X2 [Anoplophora glabripennis]|uniref:zinc finger and SCAN domain-containing protein 26 isoform X2 n=1 Tax=Anoplophora glabripennis TaxID=217634 RepID=UPI0008755510|nr:zinc finger and SCAN domain-containing protein 26 isoform X2 [Anoplophora glabripennis]
MVNSCLKCGRGSEKDKDVTLFQVPIEGKSAKWQMEFLERVGIEDFLDKDVYICNRHFLPEDFEMKNSELTLKENALPIRSDEEFEEQLEIKPEVIYFKNECGETVEVGVDTMSDTSETKDLVPLEPLVEYMNVYEDVREEVELSSEVTCKMEEAEGQTGSENVIIESEYVTNNNGTQEISVVSSDGNNLGMDPVMPFFLTSSPMFTILNENNEETIILQIEDTEDKKPPPPVKEVLEELDQSLCKSPTGSLTTTYTCDICDSSYGCLNCLKSHYETFHILNVVRRYKCKFSHHVSKSLVCPVCDLTFENRGETMDHYITHSVGCEICGSGFDRHSYLTEHYKTVHNKGDYQAFYECELCKMSYQYIATLTKHYRIFHRMTLCHVCKARFATVGELQEHEKVHQEKLNVLPFACSKCNMAFRKICDIAVHIRRVHKKDAAEEGEAEAGNELPRKVEGEDHMPVQKRVKVKK